MVGMAIFVDDELCDVIDKEEAKGNTPSLPGNVTNPPVPITIYCQPSPVLGSVVTLVKNTTRRYNYTFPYIINICEIEVWATTSTTKSTLRTGQLTTSSAGVATATDTTATTPTTESTLRTGQLTTSSAGVVTATYTTETENGFFPYITGGSVGGGLLIIFLIVAISIWIWRKRRQTSDSPEESPNTANANGSVMAKDSTGEEQNGDAASEENPYDTLDPTDINVNVYSIFTPTPVAEY
ncbi:uncharacterized protein [Littorina saxatilis]|uniref:uncharacterized protein n=1 Tax=Littorina saxatilis TaxID=31220 RepID=UPI0038B6526B